MLWSKALEPLLREREQGARNSEPRENCITSGSPLCRSSTRATYILCIEHPRLMLLSRESNPGPPALQANTLCKELFERRCALLFGTSDCTTTRKYLNIYSRSGSAEPESSITDPDPGRQIADLDPTWTFMWPLKKMIPYQLRSKPLKAENINLFLNFFQSWKDMLVSSLVVISNSGTIGSVSKFSVKFLRPSLFFH